MLNSPHLLVYPKYACSFPDPICTRDVSSSLLSQSSSKDMSASRPSATMGPQRALLFKAKRDVGDLWKVDHVFLDIPGGPIDIEILFSSKGFFAGKNARNVSGSQRLGASVVTRTWAVVEMALGCADLRPSCAKLRPKLRRIALETRCAFRAKPSSKLVVSNRAEKCK